MPSHSKFSAHNGGNMAFRDIQDANLRRVIISSLLGATIEWYDFFLYGVVAGIVFNKLYFPAADPLVSTLLAYTTFAVGFVAQPLGGGLFGHFGDPVGGARGLGSGP